MSTTRQLRTSEQIQRILSESLLRDVRDPRLFDVTITRVDIDRELQYADIYVNALGDETREEEVMKALDGAAGFFRSEVAKNVRLRTVPSLRFRWDPTLAHADEIDQLLGSLEIPPEEEASASEDSVLSDL